MKRSQKVSLNSLRGHLALNSSALKPTINKLQSQHLIQDQMTSHYYNLATIKLSYLLGDMQPQRSLRCVSPQCPVIIRRALAADLSDPTSRRTLSILLSNDNGGLPILRFHSDGKTAAIDSKAPSSTRRSIKKQDQMRRSAIIKKIQLQQELADQGYSPQEEPTMRRSLSSTRPKSSTYAPQEQTKRSPYNNTMLRSSMKINMNQTMRPKSANNATFKVNDTTAKLNKTMPRPNAREVTYNGDYLNRHSDRFVETEGKQFVPRTKKRNAKSFLSQSRHYAPPVRRPKPQKEKPSEEEDHDDFHEMNLTTVTFERTQDHEKWVEDQAQFVQTLTLNDDYEQHGYDDCSEGRKTPANKAFEKAMKKQPFRDYNDVEKAEKTRQKILDEEEELKYLSFINQVTNDILSRGIYSNKVLMKTMERHMQSRLHDLDESKMRSMLADLTLSLGIVDTEATMTRKPVTNNTSIPQKLPATPSSIRHTTTPTTSISQKHPTTPSSNPIRNSKSSSTRQHYTPSISSKASSICEVVSELHVADTVASMSPTPSTTESTSRRAKEADYSAEVTKSASRSNGTDEYESVSALATVLKVKDDEGEDDVFTTSSTPKSKRSPTSVSYEDKEEYTEYSSEKKQKGKSEEYTMGYSSKKKKAVKPEEGYAEEYTMGYSSKKKQEVKPEEEYTMGYSSKKKQQVEPEEECIEDHTTEYSSKKKIEVESEEECIEDHTTEYNKEKQQVKPEEEYTYSEKKENATEHSSKKKQEAKPEEGCVEDYTTEYSSSSKKTQEGYTEDYTTEYTSKKTVTQEVKTDEGCAYTYSEDFSDDDF